MVEHIYTILLYIKNKKWRKAMLEESLALCVDEETLINAIKHDAKLLLHNQAEVESMRYNDTVTLTRLLRMLRVYFPQSVISEWTVEWWKALTRGIRESFKRKHFLKHKLLLLTERDT